MCEKTWPKEVCKEPCPTEVCEKPCCCPCLRKSPCELVTCEVPRVTSSLETGVGCIIGDCKCAVQPYFEWFGECARKLVHCISPFCIGCCKPLGGSCILVCTTDSWTSDAKSEKDTSTSTHKYQNASVECQHDEVPQKVVCVCGKPKLLDILDGRSYDDNTVGVAEDQQYCSSSDGEINCGNVCGQCSSMRILCGHLLGIVLLLVLYVLAQKFGVLEEGLNAVE